MTGTYLMLVALAYLYMFNKLMRMINEESGLNQTLKD